MQSQNSFPQGLSFLLLSALPPHVRVWNGLLHNLRKSAILKINKWYLSNQLTQRSSVMKNPWSGFTKRAKRRSGVSVAAVLAMGIFFWWFAPPEEKKDEVVTLSYSELMEKAGAGQVKKVAIYWHTIKGTLPNGKHFKVFVDPDYVKPAEDLRVHKVAVVFEEPPPGLSGIRMLISTFLFMVIMASWVYFFFRGIGPQGEIFFKFWESRARRNAKENRKVTFNDVAGINEAKDELREVVEFLKNPDEFRRLGGRIPKGVLLIGPPGTGKTLLARAVAGEANVPFFEKSGSSFVEMYVGVGASRIRGFFDKGKEQSRCILFIDEIDAIGGKRTAASSGGDRE